MAGKNKTPEIRFAGFNDAWEKRELGEMAVFSKGQGYSKNDLSKVGTPLILYGRLYTKYQAAISEVDTFAMPKSNSIYSTGNEVIVPASGETAEDIARASAVIKSGFMLGGDLNIVYPNDSIDPVFLALSISNGEQQKELSKKAQGKSVVHLRNADLEEVKLSYPSKTEQKKIGEYFLHFDNLITLHQRKYEKLVTVKKSMLEKMFPKDGANVPEIRFSGFADAWEQRELGDVYNFQYGQFNNNPSNGGIYPVYGANGIIGGYSNFNAEDSVVIGHMGEYAGSVLWGEGKHFVTYNGTIATPKNKQIDNKYGYYMLYQLNIRKICGGSGLPFLAYDKLQKLNGVFPISVKEQIKISEFFTILDNLITLHRSKLEKLKNIKKSMLEKMFV